MALRPDTSIQYVKGIGPKLGEMLERRGLKTVKDLVEFFPRTYEDRRVARQISTLTTGELVSIKAQLISVQSFQMGASKRRIYDITIGDSSGRIHCKFFRVPYKGYFERFQPQQTVRVIGKVIFYRGRLEFHHPDLHAVDPNEVDVDELLPIYVELDGLSSQKISKLVKSALSQTPRENEESDKLPASVLQRYELPARRQAIEDLHGPNYKLADQYFKFRSPAQRRIIFEEFFWLEFFLASRRRGFEKEKGRSLQAPGDKVKACLKSLPFRPTKAQIRVFSEIVLDLKKPHPMHRLVQGDVGCGKTLVALLSTLHVMEAGHQSALMAPTEILAEQHFKNAQALLKSLGMNIELLTGSTKTADRKAILARLLSGETHLLIGTHALLEDPVQFQSLGLVIIDEQHRFGVHQRQLLKNKGLAPHFLLMTATPIPRTLALTVYGDLDVSVIDEMPPGRSPIVTRVVSSKGKHDALEFMRLQVEMGRQAYVVYPLVDESEKIDLKNAIQEFENLKAWFPQFSFGLLHGRMKPAEKDAVMREFRDGRIQVLVSTTVIEVGVDVANATLMIIEHAERFGLSQLHQLRGRVGRGVHKSHCLLVLGGGVSDEARERTSFMEKTSDGFKIAEFDLELRGPGEFLGSRQSGLAGFRMAHLLRDQDLLMQAREAAFDIMKMDPALIQPDHQKLKEELQKTQGITSLASVG